MSPNASFDVSMLLSYASYDVHYDANRASSPLPFNRHHTSTSDNLVFKLETTANKLKNAFNGVDVSWIDSGKP